ncbi:MAG: response regulator [Deltaproteobacteria bacterium]|nr:response regulator [Deltaproteobacteria bacterium]
MSLILVVDDEPGVRQTVRDWLLSEGYRVETANGVGDTIAWFRKAVRPPDALLLDIKLADGSGFQLADRLHKDYGFDKVIFMTAFFWEEETRRELGRRERPYFEKPLKFQKEVMPFLQRFLDAGAESPQS